MYYAAVNSVIQSPVPQSTRRGRSGHGLYIPENNTSSKTINKRYEYFGGYKFSRTTKFRHRKKIQGVIQYLIRGWLRYDGTTMKINWNRLTCRAYSSFIRAGESSRTYTNMYAKSTGKQGKRRKFIATDINELSYFIGMDEMKNFNWFCVHVYVNDFASTTIMIMKRAIKKLMHLNFLLFRILNTIVNRVYAAQAFYNAIMVLWPSTSS